MAEELRGGTAAAAPAARIAAVALVAAVAVALGACDALIPARSEGERLWRQRCSECHGKDGSGNTPRYMGNYKADLLDDTWEVGGDAGSWEMVIRDGVFGQMPANEELTAEQLKALVDHLRKLRAERSGTRG